jgi:tetratricopeptide (TPR) repeat protein
VEALLRGASGPLESDLDYTLRASPNHHRALLSLIRLGQKKRSPQPGALPRPIECYFERALRFRPDDALARMLYVKFLTVQQRHADALRELDKVPAIAADNGFTHLNAGMLYLDLKVYDKALQQAHMAMRLGHPGTPLRDALKSQGRWREPVAAQPPAGAASAAESG